jgi:outer membrane receptor protein involved in Fe transport
MQNLIKNAMAFFLLFFSVNAFSQTTVSGRITSVENPNGVEGATVQEAKKQNFITTDKEGKFTLKVADGANLIITFVGYKPVIVAANGSLNIALVQDVSELGQVSVTATRTPTRKLQTTTAVEIIGSKALKASKPEGIAEAIANAPGLYVNTSQGRRGGVVTRGFPDGGNPQGGLDYTAILVDGLPTFGSTGRLPEAGFGFDINVDKVEVVRGSAATLFGRSSAAGAVNVISKVGGEKTQGTVRFTSYNNAFDDGKKQLNFRMDANINGALTKDKKLRYNIGGWWLDDKGFKNTGFSDKGRQLRGNFDYKLNGKGNIRLHFLTSNFVFQNLTDIPADLTTMKIANGYKNTQTLQNFADFYNKDYTVYESWTGAGVPAARPVLDVNGKPIVRSVRQAMQDNSYGKTNQIGLNFEYQLAKDFTIEEKFRTQSMKNGTKYTFALPSYYLSNSVLRLLLDGDSKDGDVVNEVRFRYKAQTNNVLHNFTAGHYFAETYLRPTTYSFTHTLNPSDPNNIKFAPLAPPFVTAPWSGTVDFPRGGVTRRGKYTERVTSFFFGDEMKIKDKLVVNFGVRSDKVNIDMEETKKPYDLVQTRTAEHKDWSASVGFNYLITPKSAVYANVTRAFRAPDYTAYTSLEWISFADRRFLRATDGINKNEIVFNTEAGYRTTVGDNISFDIAAFRTKIDNRLATIFENGILVSKPFGSNRIYGAELSVSYLPEMIKGLSIRTNLTYQKAQFTEFKIAVGKGGVLGNTASQLNVDPNGNLYGNTLINEGGGNYSIDLKNKQLPGIPSFIWNTNISYIVKHFGADLASNFNANRYVDPTNVIKYNNLKIINLGAFGRLYAKSKTGTNEIRLGIQVKNLFNNSDIQNVAGLNASDLTLGQKQKTENFTNTSNVPIWGQGYVQLPRRWSIVVTVDF